MGQTLFPAGKLKNEEKQCKKNAQEEAGQFDGACSSCGSVASRH